MGIKNKPMIDSIERNNPYFEDMITRSVYHSNAIEGNTLSYYETYQVIFNPSSTEELKNIKPRDLYEAINLKYAMDYVMRHLGNELSMQYVLDIAMIINRNINEISSYRTSPVFILGAEHIPPNAADIPRLMQELFYTSFSTDDFLWDIADFHIKYERIHPFSDGNGRTGRVLLTKFTLENGYPPLVIPKESRNDYMNLLAGCDADGMKEMFFDILTVEKERMDSFQINTDNILLDDERNISKIR